MLKGIIHPEEEAKQTQIQQVREKSNSEEVRTRKISSLTTW
jgi:hypothetical protein